MLTIRSIAGGVALLTAFTFGHGNGRAADPKTYTFKELQGLYADALKAKGYKPEAAADGLKVATKGGVYLILVAEKRPDYLAITAVFELADSGAVAPPVLVGGNRVAAENPGVKFYINKQNHFVLQVEQYLATPESAKTVLPLALADLETACKPFERLPTKPPSK